MEYLKIIKIVFLDIYICYNSGGNIIIIVICSYLIDKEEIREKVKLI